MFKQLMTTDEKLEYLLAFQNKQEMRNYRLLAAIEAIKTKLREAVPRSELRQWDGTFEREFQISLQKHLGECERVSPGHAALIDDREPWELKLLV
jgi:hypothetical protein